MSSLQKHPSRSNYNTDEYYLSTCDDNRTNEEYTKNGTPFPEGDTCDAVPYQVFSGLDAYPIYGWYGMDTRKWRDGDVHTYEFGSLTDPCTTGKFILTAKRKKSGKKCGRGLFCPLKLWVFNVFS
jgi:hypothetical protein